MKLTDGQRLVCERVINVFETGTIKGKYGAISIYNDGPHRIRQITYGRSQTTEYGNLGRLIKMYAEAGGTLSDDLKPYVKLVGNVPLVDDENFKALLRKAGDTDPVMWATQDKFFDLAYFQPATKWADANGFTLPLSMLVIYDSFIHSGRIRGELRSRFREPTPANHGSEKVWIESYVEVRDRWLRGHGNPDVRASAYRTKDLLREVRSGNWDLAVLPIDANGTPVDDRPAKSNPKLKDIPARELDAPVPFLADFDDLPLPGASGHDADFTHKFLAALGDGPATDRTETLRRLAADAGAQAAAERLISYRDRYRPTSNPRYWAIANFDLHSAKPRLFLFDCVAGVISAHLCAHGRGSEGPADDGYAEVFSNVDGSNCSSLGIYNCDVTYFGGHGKSLYLDGLEATNSNARRRHIVMHGADYVSQSMIAKSGRIGRSLGCPAIEMGDVEKVIPALMGGSLLIIWKAA